MFLRRAEDQPVGLRAFGGLDGALQQIRLNYVVRIHEKDVFPHRAGKAFVAGMAQAAVFAQMNDGHARILFSQPVAERAAFVGRAVVHDDQLEIMECLAEQAVDGALDVVFDSISGHDDADGRHAFSSLRVCSILIISQIGRAVKAKSF